MTPKQIDLVKKSWDLVLPLASTAGPLFYQKLFELDPALKHLFNKPIDQQVNKLFAALTFAIKGLDDITLIVATVEALGIKHLDYGIKDKDYETVGTALMWTLDKALGDSYTEELEAAYIAVYTALANIMNDAAKRVNAA